MLKDAVQAIYNKVQTDLTNATPEELAYLSTSLEKLGGRATVYDVMDVGEDKKTEIQELADSVITNLNLDLTNTVNQFNTDIQEIISNETDNLNSLIDGKTIEYNLLVQTTEDNLNLIVTTAESSLETAQNDVITAAEALSNAANIANQQAINGSFFNLYLYGTLQVV